MKVILSEKELGIVEEMLREFKLESDVITELITGEKSNLTAEDFSAYFNSHIVNLNKYNSPIVTLDISHHLADGSDTESYEFYINEEFIEDYYNIYKSTFRVMINSIKDLFKQFKMVLVPMYNLFVDKWTYIIENHR